ncbi:MAG: RNA-binding domain-containing protein [bacterium]
MKGQAMNYKESEFKLTKFKELILLPAETEWVEFKEAKSNYDFDDTGRYFSALSNEANLNGSSSGWLIFGITDKPPRKIVGSNYRQQAPGLEKLKKQISSHTNHGLTFRNIYELEVDGKRVVIFEIPSASRGIPTTWDGIAYGRIGDSLSPLSLDKIEGIRKQVGIEDWSAQICERATMADLDTSAIMKARQNYKEKFPDKAREVESWDDITFLNKAKIAIQGKITRTAIILLGKDESEHFISPSVAKITWVLKNEHNIEKDYEHFGPPFLLNVEAVYAKIRNLKYRYLLDTSLFPIEITKYEPWVIREALNNCIAHQDYELRGRITIVENPDDLIFTNVGSFLPESVEKVIEQDSPPERYRNFFLANAMLNLNMIDTQGGGIKKMFLLQRQRYFPMPDYDLSEPDKVKVRIIGKVIDERYTRMLMQRTTLSLKEVIALDKVQKRKPIDNEEFKLLKRKGLIEGRKPNLFVTAKIAAVTDTRADYIKKRAFDKQHYIKMIQEYLEKFTRATRQDFDKLLLDKISDALNLEQKTKFISNLLQEVRRDGIIYLVEGKRGRGAVWELSKKNQKINE